MFSDNLFYIYRYNLKKGNFYPYQTMRWVGDFACWDVWKRKCNLRPISSLNPAMLNYLTTDFSASRLLVCERILLTCLSRTVYVHTLQNFRANASVPQVQNFEYICSPLPLQRFRSRCTLLQHLSQPNHLRFQLPQLL